MEYPSVIRHERMADGVVHMIGLVTITVSSIALMTGAALYSTIGMLIACTVYCISLMTCFYASAGYHLLPYPDWRRFLQRLDHTAIYGLIAGTATPLLVHVNSTWGYVVLAAIWALAVPAMIYKLVGKKLNTRWSLASYLILGWMLILAFPELNIHLPFHALAAILVGGILYTSGTFFYARDIQPYRYAIWHTFVFLGTVSLFSAIWITVFSV